MIPPAYTSVSISPAGRAWMPVVVADTTTTSATKDFHEKNMLFVIGDDRDEKERKFRWLALALASIWDDDEPREDSRKQLASSAI
jgi:hypothetical protein